MLFCHLHAEVDSFVGDEPCGGHDPASNQDQDANDGRGNQYLAFYLFNSLQMSALILSRLADFFSQVFDGCLKSAD